MRAIGSMAMLMKHLGQFAEVVPENDDPIARAVQEGFDLQVQLHGPSAAAWLIFTNRKKFHKSRTVDFRITKNKQTPGWFRIAFAYLEKCDSWSAETKYTLSERIYRVTWLQPRINPTIAAS